MEPIVIWVPGEPEGKDRPRTAPGQLRPYTPAKTKRAEKAIVETWRLAGEHHIPEAIDHWQDAPVTKVRVPIKMTILLLVKRLDGHFLKDGTLSTDGHRHPQPENRKPDTDNALKLAMDAMNNNAYKDDVKIVTTEIKRRWSRSRVGALITIEPEYEIGDLD